ncbi:hypothetical protein RHMOL_Rhmol10G0102200 [Rhododendron molle]|uniref:Uncharacterized protein n=1 Tax=Rhododendron molle TaxID=49168 RepID=A0ACC0M0Z8_RHOML|nr:hypothetical protein RHMOL_Rhmol10G0102200 [Rhododendron molle]
MTEKESGSVLQFAPFQSAVDEGFWHRLSSLELNKFGIDETPIPITADLNSGDYSECYLVSTHLGTNSRVSNHLSLIAESLPPEPSEQSSVTTNVGNRNRCSVPGILYNTNTFEGFHALNKQGLLKAEAQKVWDDIHSGKAEEDCAVLARFLLISFADLKKWSFHYWFSFPALVLYPPATLVDLRPASQWLSLDEAESLSAACNEWRSSSVMTVYKSAQMCQFFFFVSIASNSHVTIKHLKEWPSCQQDGNKFLFGFYDPCHIPTNPGWPLRNFLALIGSRWNLEKVCFFCYRENRGFADLSLSLIGEALLSVSQGFPENKNHICSGWKDTQHVPNAVGWEFNRGKKVPTCICLAQSMDPKSLLLGAGTLGCQVARMLMEAEGVVMGIPMPGHPVPSQEENSVLQDFNCQPHFGPAMNSDASRACTYCFSACCRTFSWHFASSSWVSFPSLGLSILLLSPCRICAKAEFANSMDSGSTEQPLGILPHQVRGSLSQFSQMTLVGHASNSCAVCCTIVVLEYRKRGMDFVLQAINHPTYLEDLTGLIELMKSTSSFQLDWDNETDDDDCIEIKKKAIGQAGWILFFKLPQVVTSVWLVPKRRHPKADLLTKWQQQLLSFQSSN